MNSGSVSSLLQHTILACGASVSGLFQVHLEYMVIYLYLYLLYSNSNIEERNIKDILICIGTHQISVTYADGTAEMSVTDQ